MSNIELAERVGLSPSACLQRTKALEDAGYIVQYTMSVNLDRLFQNQKFIVSITLRSHRQKDVSGFEAAIKDTPEFVECLRVNANVDYLGLVVCSNISVFNRLRDGLLAREPNIARIDSHTILEVTKHFSGYPFERLTWKL